MFGFQHKVIKPDNMKEYKLKERNIFKQFESDLCGLKDSIRTD